MKNKITVGQLVFSLNIGNAARNREQKLTPMVITKVGRKYFSARYLDDSSGWSEIQYYVDSGIEKTNFSANSCIYLSEKEYDDEVMANNLYLNIKNSFSSFRNKKFTLSQLSRINDILEE